VRISREDILAIYEEGPEAVIQLVEFLTDTIDKQSDQIARMSERIAELEERVKELEARLKMNSTNSHKPPSSDGPAKPPVLKRKKGERPSGGQRGHEGHTLRMVDNPEETVVHSPRECSSCGRPLGSVKPEEECERRQVFDLPPINIAVTEHRSERKVCPRCGELNRAPFPHGVEAPAQYGNRLKAFASYLNCYQLIPLGRACEMIGDIFGHEICEATLVSATSAMSEILEPVMDAIGRGLLASSVLNLDETGMSVEGKGNWLHVTSTDELTLYAVHGRRGRQAMNSIGILPLFTGTIVHDFWRPYFAFPCRHALCNAHILRELKYVHEVLGQLWAGKMIKLLLDIKAAVDEREEKGFSSLSWWKGGKFTAAYQEILDTGFLENPPPDRSGEARKRGRPKKTKALNLLERMRDYRKEILLFMKDFSVGFDNNLSERDLRMAKVKMKISGTFRSWDGAHAFCRIRSYVSTAKKNSIPVIQALEDALNGKPFIPVFAQ